MSDYVRVADASEIVEGKSKCFEVGREAVAVFRIDGELYAIADECSHVGGPLSEGFIEGCEVECPWHGARFNIKTGAALTSPADGDVKRYELRVVDGEIEIKV